MIAQCNILNIGDILILHNGLIGLICIIQCIDELDVNLLIFLCGFAEIDRIAAVFLDRLISQRYFNGMGCTDTILHILRKIHRQVIHCIIKIIHNLIIDGTLDIRQINIRLQGIIIFQEITANLITLKQACSVIAGVVFIAVILQNPHIRIVFDNRFAVTEV